MLNKKSYFILLVSLLIIGLAGCGGGGTADLDVSGAQLKSITISPANPQLAVNTSQQFTATGIYEDNTTRDLTSSVEWSSSAVDVASGIEEARFTGLYSSGSTKPGHVTATAWGRAKITGKYGTTSGSTDVTVTTATIVSLAVTPANPSIALGTTKQFTAMGTFSDNTTQDLTTDAAWNSSAADIATISSAIGSNGLATPTAVGTTTITAVFGGVSRSAALTVTATAGTGTMSISWNIPTTYTNGGSLTDIAGYKIYVGNCQRTYTQVINVGNTTSSVINNLAAGTYYVSVTVYNTTGIESDYSNEIYLTVL